ncbi:MAG: D-Ala-D-Ala carboxypeptidase family metallohydrolase [Pseudomonadota bacterium]|nr:D-Ala-D-Ala carboxypeptidase family metallohydrolase [Pseudomonadota bacterium]
MANHSRTKPENLSLAKLAPQDFIAPNFRLHELTRSEIASRLGVDNAFPGDRELRAAVHLARKVLQPLRDTFGGFTPNSVFRSQALERVLKRKPSGWLSTSQHTRACACDIEIVGKSTLELAQWAADNLPDYDQIICECYDPDEGPNSGWVHLSLKPPEQGENRKQLLSYIRDMSGGQWLYVPGLRASVG